MKLVDNKDSRQHTVGAMDMLVIFAFLEGGLLVFVFPLFFFLHHVMKNSKRYLCTKLFSTMVVMN